MSENTYYKFQAQDIELDYQKIFKIVSNNISLQHLKTHESPDDLIKIIKSLGDSYLHLVEPAGVSKTIPVKLIRNIFAESLPTESPIYKALGSWVESAIFILTIGPYPEMSVTRLLESGDIIEAVCLDSISNFLVESFADRVRDIWMEDIEIKLPKNMKLYATRYSPGFCKWRIEGLIPIFGYAAEVKIPVTLVMPNRMYPSKSIAGVIAVEVIPNKESLTASCKECKQRCEYMRVYPH
jgi:hypothetical protein